MYKYYKLNKEVYTKTHRTVGRMRVEEDDVDCDSWRIFNIAAIVILFIFSGIPVILFDTPWILGIWVAICVLLISVRVTVVSYRYKKYLDELSRDENQSVLEEIFNNETDSIEKELEAYSKIEMGKLTLEDFNIIEEIKNDLTW